MQKSQFRANSNYFSPQKIEDSPFYEWYPPFHKKKTRQKNHLCIPFIQVVKQLDR